MEMKFYRCAQCGQIVAIVKKTGVPVICCGEPMKELIPGTTDAAAEKHVPSFEVKGDVVEVTVGSVEHPMLEEHYIEWIAVQTKQGNQRKSLEPGEPPKACFRICDGDEVEAVYAYCNLHSLWKAE
jgi:superoxide reductase